ncbi:MAG: PIN domain-containing protein [Thermomicrobiales bacterium]
MTASVARWRRVVLDANVLVQAPIRDLILRAAEDELLVVYWGPTILTEVERTLRDKLFAGRSDAIARTGRLLHALGHSFPRALRDDDRAGLPILAIDTARGSVPPEDGHVLATAVRANAGAIVTYNLRHFPTAALRPHRLVAVPPDRLLVRLFRHEPTTLISLLVRQGADLQPPRDLDAVLARLADDVPHFVADVRANLSRW